MLRRVVVPLVVGLAALLVCTVAGWPQALGLERAAVVANVVALRSLAAIGAAGAILVLLLMAVPSHRARRPLLAIVAALAVFIAGTAAVQTVRGWSPSGGDASAGGVTLRVLAWNVLADGVDPAVVADLVARTGAEVVSLPETTSATGEAVVDALAESGVVMQRFTVSTDATRRTHSTTLLVAERLGGYRLDASARPTELLPSVVARPVSGDGPVLVAVHASAPLVGTTSVWRADLGRLAALCDDPEVVLAGDFNATPDHFGAPLLGTVRLGACVDGAASLDTGAAGTWPSQLPPALGTPIDHVLTAPGWITTSFEVRTDLDDAGSDHRPILAVIAPAGS